MKQFALLTVVLAVVALIAPSVTLANTTEPTAGRSTEIAVPVVDVFEEGDCRLRFIAMPSADLKSTFVTLIYEDRAMRTIRAVTVNPEVVLTVDDPKFNDFMSDMDSDFKSYIRATLADRLLHLVAEGSVLDRAAMAIFFGSSNVRFDAARRVSASESATE